MTVTPDDTLTIDRSWWSWSGVHGGLLASLMVDRLHADHPGRRLRGLSVGFLAAADERPIALETTVRPAGRTTVFADLLAVQGDDAVATAQAVLGVNRTGPAYTDLPAPAAPPPDGLETLGFPVELVPFAQHLEFRPISAARPFAGGDSADLVAWVRLHDGRPLTPATVTLLLDAFAPALYAVLRDPVPIPTVQMNVQLTPHLDGGPVEGWALGRIHTRHAGDGWAVDDSTIWSASGELLGLCRQTRRVIVPAERG
ncbi:thioesterase family protein [Thermobifida halotolerans]|uniref:Thioesterase family protein n=1 Tax=Thermobifida halotolerans TaxID=483545 RepID=A0A399G4Y5_9ACTN|nr:thioesterase family protein [Thermobifida halotolerans]UOE17802.1 thioesterase family protein [Thermobifida halotolerans]